MIFTKQFPHITRIITAGFLKAVSAVLRIAILSLFISITILNYHTQFFPENEEFIKLKLQTLKYPSNPDSYTSLAVYFFKHELDHEMLATFQIAQTLFNNKYGNQQLSPISIYQELLNKKQFLSEKEKYWEKIVIDKSTYRDAYLQRGVLLYQLGMVSQAQKSITTALALDPQYPYKDYFNKLLGE